MKTDNKCSTDSIKEGKLSNEFVRREKNNKMKTKKLTVHFNPTL